MLILRFFLILLATAVLMPAVDGARRRSGRRAGRAGLQQHQQHQQQQQQHRHHHAPRWRPNSAAVTRSGWGSSASPLPSRKTSHSRQASPPPRQLPPGASDLLAEEAAADFACLDGQQLDRLSLDSLQFACWSLALSSVGTWPRGVAESPVLVVPQPTVLASRSWLPGILAAPRTRYEPLSRAGPNGRLK